MRKLFWLGLWASGSACLYAGAIDLPRPLETFIAGPNTLVNGSVSVISGDYVESSTDLVVPGEQGLSFSRSYSSSDRKKGSLSTAWSHNYHNWVDLFSKRYRDGYQHVFGTFRDPSGACVVMESGPRTDESAIVPLFSSLANHGYGLTNAGSGVLGAHSNLLNLGARWDFKGRTLRNWNGAGIQRDYRWREPKGKHAPKNQMELVQDRRPDGSILKYSHDARAYLSRIELFGPSGNALSWVDFQTGDLGGQKNTKSIRGKSSTGEEFYYQFLPFKASDNKKPRQLLVDAESTRGPKVHYDYSDTSAYSPRVTRKTWENGGYIDNTYYHKGRNYLDDKTVKVFEENDQRQGRVAMQMAPVGTDDTPLITHRYFYHFYRRSSEKDQSKYTEVRDAYNHATRYYWNSEGRTTAIEEERRDAKGISSPYCRQGFYWGKQKTVDDSRLLCQSMENGSGSIRHCRSFSYDKVGNVLVDTFYGNLSGEVSRHPLIRDGKVQANGVESFARRCTYSQDGFNLLLSEVDDSGRRVEYQYEPGTDRMISRCMYVEGELYEQRLYTYDENSCVVEERIGDGSTWQHVKRQEYIKGVGFQLPVYVEEFFLDLLTGEELPVGSIRNTYDRHALCLRTESFDAEGALLFAQDYAYDDKRRLIETTDSRGRQDQLDYDLMNEVSSHRHSDGREFNIERDRMGRTICRSFRDNSGKEFTTRTHYDRRNQPKLVSDPFGNYTTMEYDEFGNMICIVEPKVLDASGKEIRPKSLIAYDCEGRIDAETNSLGEVTRYQYNSRGQVTSKKSPDGSVQNTRYNLDGSVKWAGSPHGLSKRYQYDAIGRVLLEEQLDSSGACISEHHYIYDKRHLLQDIDGRGVLTEYRYDLAGRIISKSVTDGDSLLEEEYSYDAAGRLFRVDRPNESEICEFDAWGRVCERRIEFPSGLPKKTTCYVYDDAGRVVRLRESIGEDPFSSQSMEYDVWGELVSVSKANEKILHFTYNRDVRNDLGQRVMEVRSTDALGRQRIQRKDALGRIVHDRLLNSFGLELSCTVHGYDALGQLLRTEHLTAEGEQAFSRTYKRGPGGRIEMLIEESHSGRQELSFHFDTLGRPSTRIAADGTVLQMDYDAQGKVLRKWSSDGTVDHSFDYDEVGQMLSARDNVNGHSVNFAYDVFGQIIEENALAFSYDDLGRRSQMTLPDGSAVAYSYSENGLERIQRLSSSHDELYVHSYLRDSAARAIQMELPGIAGTVDLSYDERSRLRSIQHPLFEELLPEGAFDAQGHLLRARSRDSMGDLAEKWTYDASGQLSSESGVLDRIFGFGAFGRSDKSQGVYDACGNRQHLILNDEEARCRYDALGQLIEVIMGAKRIEYEYDALQRCVLKRVFEDEVETSSEGYLFDASNEIGILDRDGAITHLRILGQGLGAEIGATVAIEMQDHVYAPLHDHRGNIRCLIDASDGQSVSTSRYSAFGLEEHEGEVQSPWRFSSKRVDEDTGLLHFGRRVYSPDLGQWLSPDPLGQPDGPNRYTFLRNDPMSHIDLYGFLTQGLTLADLEFGTRKTDDGSRNYIKRNSLGPLYRIPKSTPPEASWRTRTTLGGFYDGLENLAGIDGLYRNNHSGLIRYGDRHFKGIRIAMTPGILTRRQEAYEDIHALSEMTRGSRVYMNHNQSYGFLWDVIIFALRPYVPTASVDLGVLLVRWLIADLGGPDSGGVVYLLGHSEGCNVTYELLNRLDKEERQMINVISLGRAKSIPEKLAMSSFSIENADDLVIRVSGVYHGLKGHSEIGQCETLQFTSGRYPYEGLELIDSCFEDPIMAMPWGRISVHSFLDAGYQTRLGEYFNTILKDKELQ